MTSFNDILAIGPAAIISLAALIVLTIEALTEKSEGLIAGVSLGALVVAALTALLSVPNRGTAFSGMVMTGGFAGVFAALFSVAGLLSLMLSPAYLRKQEIRYGEYFAMVLFAIVGMMLMAAAADLVILFLGLELMSVSFYVLAGFARRRAASNDAALKYFLLGAFATGFLLYRDLTMFRPMPSL